MDSEFPAGSGSGGMGTGAAAEEDYSRMPLEDRLSSKVWKARVSGYEDLVKQFEKSPSDTAPIFKPFTRNSDAVKAMVTDSNAVAQEKGMEAVRSFLLYGGKGAGATRETVMPAIVEKCFGAMRAGTKKLALEIVSLFAEMEDSMGCEGLIQDLLKGTAAKQPKIIATSVVALSELIRDFGPKQTNPKLIIKKLPDLFGHSDKTVRSEAANLAKELHKWIGAALEPTTASLKEIQAKELREQFAQLDAAGRKQTSPTRYLTSQRPTPEAAIEDDEGEALAAGQIIEDEADPIDPRDFAEPVDPMKEKDWPENLEEMLASPKWLERKDVLAQCLKVLEKTPKMIHTMSIDSFIDVLCEKVKRDSNINVALVACQCITRLAMGLRNDFAKNKDKALPALLEKLKERKESTVKTVSETLDAVFQTMTLGDILEQTLNATKHKNPAVKAGSIQFLARCLRETRHMPSKADVKPIAEALVAAIADGSADVRDAGAQGLGTLMKLLGERPMNQFIDGLDDIKKSKIQEQYKEAAVKVKQAATASNTSSARPAATSAARPGAPQKLISSAPPKPSAALLAVAGKENIRPGPAATPPSSLPARLAIRKPAAVPAPTSASSSTRSVAASSSKPVAKPVAAVKGSKPGKTASATEPVKFRFHPEEADAKAAEVVPSHLVEEISNSVWKERLAGMVKFNEWLKVEAAEVESELIVRFLSKKPGWKESNFQVMAEVYNALCMLAQECPTFGRASVALSITPLCEKLGDVKLKGPAGDSLTLYAEKTSFGFVLLQALTPLGNIKAPKAIADSLIWVNDSILAFGTSGVDVKSVIEYLLTCLKSPNAVVRSNATTVIGTLARFLGPALTTFLGDLNAQLRSSIEAEIDKATQQPAPVPTRFSEESRPRGDVDVGSTNGHAATDAGVDEDALDALIPRVDLDQIMPSTAIARAGDANWKERKEGLEEINAILDANTRLKPNMGEVGTALKLRFADNNIQVRTLALEATGKIATGMNKGFTDHARAFVAPITQVLADAKAPIRASAAKVLTAIAEQVGPAPMIPAFSSVLESKVANPMLKQDLFTWLGQWFDAHPPEKGMELNGLALPAILCLDDKLAAVRKAAQTVLPYIIMRAGYKFVMDQTNGLKTASRNTVVPLIDAAKSQAMAKGPSLSAQAAAAVVALMTTGAKVPKVVRNPSVTSSEASTSGPASNALPDLPTATPRRGLMKPPSVVGRALKPAAMPIAMGRPSIAVVDATSDSSRSATPRLNIAKRPTLAGPSSSSSTANTVESKSFPFLHSDGKFKALREKKEATNRLTTYWIGPEATPRPELTEVLRQQCEHHLGNSLISTMFSKDHNAERDYLTALTLLVDYVANPASAMDDYGLDAQEATARAVANSDLVLKYAAIRLTDNNTSILLKCLDLLEHLIALLREQEYHMSDYEANAIVPCLIAKFGDPKASLRDRIRQEIFRKLTYIYPPSKILTHYIDEGLTSKNARVRTECLGELGNLFSKNGPQVCSLPKVLPIIAQHISDRDNGVRTAALLAIGEVYKLVGEEETWRCVGKLPLKESNLLEERLKRTVGPVIATAPPAPSLAPAPARSATSAAPQVSKLPSSSASRGAAAATPAVHSSPVRPQGRKVPVPSRLARPASMMASGIPTPGSSRNSIRAPSSSASGIGGIGRPAINRAVDGSAAEPAAAPSPALHSPSPISGQINGSHRRTRSSAGNATVGRSNAGGVSAAKQSSLKPHPSTSSLGEDEMAVEQAINEILSSDSDRSVMALKQVDAEIQNLAPSLLRHADQLTIAFGKQLHRAFSIDRAVVGNDRLKKNLLFTGISMFDNTRLWEEHEVQRTLGSFISKPALVSLLTELLQRLIETSGATDEETQAHGRYLNIIVLRTFSSCNLNVLFGACLAMLTEATEDLEELLTNGNESILQKRVKFSELIIKCLWKITRKLHASLQDELIDPTILLQDLERLMQAIPPSEWKRRASIGLPLGEMPLRTIKVIITHIGSCFGEEALDLLEGIPNAEDSHVYKFLLRVCDRGGVTNGLGVEEEDMATESASAPASPIVQRKPSAMMSPRPRLPASPSKEDFPSPRMVRRPESIDGPEAAINAELRDIFDRIALKAQSRAAIKDLYLFQKRYPHKEANIQRSLESTGPIFQKFIKRALANHAAEDDEAGDTEDGMSGKRSSAAGHSTPSDRNSAAIDWAATAASINRNSAMSPPSARSSYAGSAALVHSPSFSASATSSPNMQRKSATDDRLAQLRAKFARSTSGTSETSS